MPKNLMPVDKFDETISPERFLEILERMGLTYTLHHHRAVFSVSESSDIDAEIPGAHTRNLFLRDKKENMFLLTLMAHTKIDLNLLPSLLGSGRLSFGSPDRLKKYLGITPGSVTPFAVVNNEKHAVKLILDKEMMEKDIVNFHPLINTMTVGLTPDALLKFLANIGCPFQIMDLAPATKEE